MKVPLNHSLKKKEEYIVNQPNIYWLVVWKMTFIFQKMGIILPIDELIFFRGVETTTSMG